MGSEEEKTHLAEMADGLGEVQRYRLPDRGNWSSEGVLLQHLLGFLEKK